MVGERSTKRQQELLNFVDQFIKEHGYGPSYREIMRGLGYKSVSTVAIHIDGLLSKGYVRKRDKSARSLEVVSAEYVPGRVGGGAAGFGGTAGIGAGLVAPGLGSKSAEAAKRRSREAWLVGAVMARFSQYAHQPSPQLLDELYVLVGALKVLGFEAAYEAMRIRLAEVVKR